MMRAIDLVICAGLLGLVPVEAAAQSHFSESKPVTTTATIEAIDQATRMVTLKGPKGNSVEVKAPEQMQGFKDLKVGDQVTATYFEATAIEVRKPGAPAPSTTPITTTTRQDRKAGSVTQRQQTVSVTVEAIDAAVPSITVKGPQGHVVTMKVRDPKQLQNVKAGDTLDVTYFESLLVKVARPKKG
jgi:hypothetical protein